MTEVKRYSVQAGFMHETAYGTYCKFSDHDRLVSSLREEVERLRKLYHELLYQVCNVVPGESRHESAKRIIYQHENRPSEGPCSAMEKPE
jgi:hypothetical protein